MAATDKAYRSQHTLDIVFAVTSILMLASILLMLWQDYAREFKTEQRRFRDVEAAVAQRQALKQMPAKAEVEAAEQRVVEAKQTRESKDEEVAKLKREVDRLRPQREQAEIDFQKVKADLESINSFVAIETEHTGNAQAESVQTLIARRRELEKETARRQDVRDNLVFEMKHYQSQIDDIESPLTTAVGTLNKLNGRFDTQAKLAVNKRWGWGDWFRSLPVIEGFASPTRIQQVTNNDIPIDYNFKQVTRFDRCGSCHVGIDRPAYTRQRLEKGFAEVTPEEQQQLDDARAMLVKRRDALAGLPEQAKVPDPSLLQLSTVPDSVLTPSRVVEFAAHPRLDLFVGSNSKHPAEKFGCSACHDGQGSATSFTLAAHSPNSIREKERWIEQHDWEAQHMWDYPMLPHRFVEASCLKCHHEVTDLVTTENRVEAPKLLRGFNLIKENGCFGCHEIAGTKGGVRIGPDLRLEPSPPLEDLPPGLRDKLLKDVENIPGTLRRVGPSLFRLAEKTNPDFTAKWLRSPRSFRPDTKMPHFYGLANNNAEALKGTGQEQFPDTEIWAVTDYLFNSSKKYVQQIAGHAHDTPEARLQDERRMEELLAKGKERFDEPERKDYEAINTRMKLRQETVLTDLAPKHPGDAAQGRLLFTERGCLACHVHEGTTRIQSKNGDKDFVPEVHGEAVFGPNLSQIAGKLGQKAGDKTTSRTWLIQWLLNPHNHSPRSRMPITHLSPEQAADISAWLLAQPPTDLGEDWNTLTVAVPDGKQLRDLARVYLSRLMTHSDLDALLEGKGLAKELTADLPVEERQLADHFNDDNLKLYLGKKAVGRLGCYGCHDVPGFEGAKSIGVGLNDWGKKKSERLAFEDIDNYIEKYHYVVPSLRDEDGKPYPPKTVNEGGAEITQTPYEAFFADELTHQHLDGFLNQKLMEPRSYDYHRLRAWDDRYRMPQFRFARARRRAGENDADFKARALVEEAEAREAVMTFVLGLVADPIPTKMINQPSGDRLAVVKGRQILDKYNCNGCHLSRPGAYDFKIASDSLKWLEKAHGDFQDVAKTSGNYTFLNHRNWVGPTPPTGAEQLVAHGTKARYLGDIDGEKLVMVRLTEAVRYVAPDKSVKDVPSSMALFIPLKDLVADPDQVNNQADLDRRLASEAPYGGTLSDLLTPYLAKKNPNVYKMAGDEITGFDSGTARASLPPSLQGEGERTQPGWLYQFLLDPSAVRKMSILRMPKFNMSPDEAQTLVAYFAGLERLTNPGIGLSFPQEVIPAQADLDGTFWSRQTGEYVRRLQAAKTKDKAGKETSAFDARLSGYRPLWDELRKEGGGAIVLDAAKKELAERTQARDAKRKEIEEKKGDKKDLEGFDASVAEARAKVDRLAKAQDPEAQQQAWKQHEAYAADAWRLLAHRKLCLQCHQVGEMQAGNPETQGPPLALAHARLRPDWVSRWIATPQHFLPYNSPMPIYFPANKKADYQNLFAGTNPQQIEAIRDALMNYPRVSSLPVNRVWRPEMGEEKKEAGK